MEETFMSIEREETNSSSVREFLVFAIAPIIVGMHIGVFVVSHFFLTVASGADFFIGE